jgi:hypothetical protein
VLRTAVSRWLGKGALVRAGVRMNGRRLPIMRHPVTLPVTLRALNQQQLSLVMMWGQTTAPVTKGSHLQRKTHPQQQQQQQWMSPGLTRTAARDQISKPSAGSKGQWLLGACRH